MHPQKKGLFSWFSIFQIRVSFNIFEIELAVSREITIELQFFFFSPRNGSNVLWKQRTFCLLWCRQTPDTSLSCLPVWHGVWILTCCKNGSLGLTAPWERQPYWPLARKTNMSKTKLFCLLTWSAPPGSSCTSWRSVLFFSIPRQLLHVPTVTASWAQSLCLSLSLHDATTFLSSAMVGAEG